MARTSSCYGSLSWDEDPVLVYYVLPYDLLESTNIVELGGFDRKKVIAETLVTGDSIHLLKKIPVLDCAVLRSL